MNQNLKEDITHGTSEYPFALYRIRNAHHPFSVSLHWHDEVEIIYVEQGILHLTIDKTTYTAETGSIFIVNSQEIHEMSLTDTNTIYYTILFPLNSLIFQMQDNCNQSFLLPLSEQTMLFSTNLNESAYHSVYETKLKELISIYYKKSTAYQLGTKSCLLSLIYLLYTNSDIHLSKKDLTYNKLHREILYYINENYLETIPLEDIANHFHMAPKYFSRYFKNIFHTTLTEYITQLRLEKALELLQHSELSVTEIALQTGFSSCSYFNKRFKSTFGKSPKKYLEQIKTYHTTQNTY